MLCVVIKGPSIEQAYKQIEQAQQFADLVEWRLDHFDSLNLTLLQSLKNCFSIQTIFTLRSTSQGGLYAVSEEQRLLQIKRLASLNPTYIDLEYPVSLVFFNHFKQEYPGIKIILSYHNFKQTPLSLSEVLEEMQVMKAHFYKIAVMAHSSLDTLSLLDFAKSAASNVIAMSMGETGGLSRILASIVGSCFTYASLDQDQTTAIGQLSAKELIDVYDYKSLTPSTAIYGLIGYPVEGSVSHFSHNKVMQALNLSSIYIKIPVLEEQLSYFFKLAKKLGFRGLSVTMPLKEQILPYLDEIDPVAKKIGAVNTLIFTDRGIKGYNTDGIGALDAIENKIKVKGKKLILIGAGGACKAIAWEACQRGADVLIFNRNERKARELADRLGCRGGSLDQVGMAIDQDEAILVNGTPDPLPIDAQWIHPGLILMDLKTKPKMTEFLLKGQEKGCSVIYGYEMFINQAVAQFAIWFNLITTKTLKQIMKVSVLEYLD